MHECVILNCSSNAISTVDLRSPFKYSFGPNTRSPTEMSRNCLISPFQLLMDCNCTFQAQPTDTNGISMFPGLPPAT